MPSYINEELRRLVALRAEYLCEYCLIHEEDTFYGCEVDHIISLKHGGPTEAENLAYACAIWM
jgi:5-methylcytosine-specific restriction endonuclease McrA